MRSKDLTILDFIEHAYNKKFNLLKIFFLISFLFLSYFSYNYIYIKKVQIKYQINLSILNKFDFFNVTDLNRQYVYNHKNILENIKPYKKFFEKQNININSEILGIYIKHSNCDNKNESRVILCEMTVNSKVKAEILKVSRKINLVILNYLILIFIYTR